MIHWGFIGCGSWSFVASKNAHVDAIDFIGTQGKLSCLRSISPPSYWKTIKVDKNS